MFYVIFSPFVIRAFMTDQIVYTMRRIIYPRRSEKVSRS